MMLWMLIACGPDAATPGDLAIGDLAPDFQLEDVNAASATYGERIGPNDARGQPSAWYFGHAN